MNYYPVFLDLREKEALVVGGGGVAARKVEGLLECGTSVTVIAPELHPDLRKLKTKIRWLAKEYEKEDLSSYFLVIAATSNRAVNERIWKYCRKAKKLVNVVDLREQCNFIAPGVARSQELTIAVSTGGSAPFLTRYLAEQFRRDYGKSFQPYLEMMKKARLQVKKKISDPESRNRIFARLCAPEILERARRGDKAWVQKAVKSILESAR